MGDSVFEFSGAHQGEAVVHYFANRIRSQTEGLAKLADGLLLRGRVLVEGLAQVAVAPQTGIVGLAALGVQRHAHSAHGHQHECGD